MISGKEPPIAKPLLSCYHARMDATTKTVEFVSFCIEMYAREHGISGADVAELFERNGIIDYLFENYEALHTQGREYIVPLLHEFVSKKELPA